jgi:hypothetical protein
LALAHYWEHNVIISELQDLLEKHKRVSGDVEVLITYEDRVCGGFIPDNIYVAGWGSLIIDANDNKFKAGLQALKSAEVAF